MAVMIPKRLPDSHDIDSERRVFQEFKNEFSDDFVIFSNVSWVSKKRGGGAHDGEADFVVAHPRHGLLVLEVKGGGVEFDAQSREWTSVDRNQVRHRIKDPFQQAKRSMYALRALIRESEPTKRYRYPMGYAAVFPDSYIRGDPGVDAPREIVLDHEKVQTLKQSIIDAFKFWRDPRDDDVSVAGMEALQAILGSSWNVEMTIGASLDNQESRILELTEQQFQTLNLLGGHPQALISGCAGTGKTMLALEKARRLSRLGFHVLFTCFNRNLSAWAKLQVTEEITVRTFHSLCLDFARRAATPLDRGRNEADYVYFARFPDALADASERVEERFDAIVVDEGQDFEEDWWIALQSVMTDPDDGVFYVFFDDNQRIYDRRGEFPIAGPPFQLTENCRNTQMIHKAVLAFYGGPSPPSCKGPPGDPIVHIDAMNPKDELERVAAKIDWLVREQHVAPSDVAILTPKKRERSMWQRSPSRNWSLTWDLEPDTNQVVCSTIASFKGLERPVVVLTELAELDPAEKTELMYVALSRARQLLCVAGPEIEHYLKPSVVSSEDTARAVRPQDRGTH